MENGEGSGSSSLGKRFRFIIPVSCIQLYTKQTIMFNKTWKFRSSSWWFQPIWKICSSNWIMSPSIRGGNWKKCLKPPNQSSFRNKKNLCESFISKMGFSKWHRHISQANLLPYSCNSNPSKGQIETRCTDELQEKTIRTLSTGFFKLPVEKPMRCPYMFLLNTPQVFKGPQNPMGFLVFHKGCYKR